MSPKISFLIDIIAIIAVIITAYMAHREARAACDAAKRAILLASRAKELDSVASNSLRSESTIDILF